MKKSFLIIVSSLLLISVISCGDKKKSDTDNKEKKASTLTELQKKYDDKDFEKCDEFINFYEEAMDVYCKTIDKALTGDEQALEDFEAFEDYIEIYEFYIDHFNEECPEKMEKAYARLLGKMDKYEDKISKLKSSYAATTLLELKNKYDGVVFMNCDESLAYAQETFDVYFATIDRAIDGDKQALEDFNSFMDYFNSYYNSKLEGFEDDCPEEMDNLQMRLSEKFEIYKPKLEELAEMSED